MTALKMLQVLTFSEYFTYQLPRKEYLITLFKFCLVLSYLLISVQSALNCVTLLRTIAKWWCIKLCAFFSVPLRRNGWHLWTTAYKLTFIAL